MSTFVKAFSDVVALFLQALRLSAILPAFIWVGLNVSVVVPLVRETRLYRIVQQSVSPISSSLIVVSLVLLVAYALGVLNVPIIRFFEGYTWLGLGGWLRASHQRRVSYLQRQIGYLDNKVNELNDRAEHASGQELDDLRFEADQYEMKRNLFRSELIWMYPHHQTWRVLPTRLGNVLAAAEEFPGHLYGIDSVTFWPFLSPILTEEGYATFVERERAILDFLLNCSVIALVFGGELVYLDILLNQFDWASSLGKLLTALILAFCFYLLSLQGALGWGYTIRTAFVLYKDKLRERLGLVHPTGYYHERVLWKDASRFYRDHDITPGRTIFDYSAQLKPKDKNRKKPDVG